MKKLISILVLSLWSLGAHATVLIDCTVPNANPEGTKQPLRAVIEQLPNGKLSAKLSTDNSSMISGVEVADPNDTVYKIFVENYLIAHRKDPRFKSHRAYGFTTNPFPGSKYMGILFTALDASGASLGSEVYIGFGGGHCQ